MKKGLLFFLFVVVLGGALVAACYVGLINRSYHCKLEVKHEGSPAFTEFGIGMPVSPVAPVNQGVGNSRVYFERVGGWFSRSVRVTVCNESCSRTQTSRGDEMVVTPSLVENETFGLKNDGSELSCSTGR